MIISFSTNLLSAGRTGNPQLTNTSISGVGVSILSATATITQHVVIVSLSSNEVGIAFDPTTYTIASNSLSTFSLSNYPVQSINVNGSVFLIPSLMEGQTFAIVEDNLRNYTAFTFLSSVTTVPVSSQTATNDILTPNRKRLRLYGYI